MNKTTTTPVETPVRKTPLSRKAVILTGAAIGLIIAGGIAYFKDAPLNGDVVSEQDSSED